MEYHYVWMWKKRLTDILVLIVLCGVSFLAMYNLTKPGLPMFHDSNPHISRMIAYHTALQDGQRPPMWAKEVLGGIGSPVLMLNYQLPYMIGELWVKSGLNYFDSYKLTLALSFLFSGWALYITLRQKYQMIPALFGTLVYLLAPYRMVDIFVRGAYGEALAFIFPPLILLGYFRKSTAWLTIGWTGLFLTHPLASAAFTVFFLGYALFASQKGEKLMVLKRHGIAFLLAFMIASFNLLPTLALTKYTYYSPEDSGPLSQFPTFSQLIHSPWGYGVSVPGPHDGMSFAVGYVQWTVLILALGYWVVAKIRKWSVPSEIGYLLITTIICFFFMLSLSTPLYTALHLVRIIDLPWRLLLCIVFASSWLACFLASRLSLKLRLLPFAVVVILWYLALPMMQTPPKYWHKTVQFFARETGDSYGEYAPKYRATRDSAPFWLRAEAVQGKADVTTELDHSNDQQYTVVTNESVVIRINTSYFTGWHVYIDGDEQTIDTRQIEASSESRCYVTSRTQKDIDDSGLMACHIVAGTHALRIRYLAPAVQQLGNLISLLGSGGFIWIVFQSFYPHTTKAKRSSKT